MKKNKKTTKKILKIKRPEKAKKVGVAKKAAKRPRKKKMNKKVKKAFLGLGKIKKDIFRLKKDFSDFYVLIKEMVSPYLNFGKMTPHQAKVSILVTSIIFASLAIIIEKYEYSRLVEKISEPKSVEELKKEYLERKIREVVKGSPMEEMVPYIAEKDKKTAAFLVGIAKKESNWGKRKPVFNGEDCFNYWGFRQERERMGSGGHTCFDNPKDAVDTVAARVSQIIERNNADSARKMVVWKCGYSCATHSDESVRKWISDVDMYAGKILN